MLTRCFVGRVDLVLCVAAGEGRVQETYDAILSSAVGQAVTSVLELTAAQRLAAVAYMRLPSFPMRLKRTRPPREDALVKAIVAALNDNGYVVENR